MITTTVSHWLATQSPAVLLSIGTITGMIGLLAFMLAIVAYADWLDDRNGLESPRVDPSRPLPLTVRHTALPCIECPHKRAAELRAEG